MTVQEFLNSSISLLNLCAVYYVTQLLKCVQISFIVYVCVFFLRKILPQNMVFLKGALWSLFIPVIFAGKMKFYYENTLGILVFSWWTEICKVHIWVNWLYLCGIFVCAVRLSHRKRKLKQLVASMEKRNVDGICIYVTKMPVTPLAIGGFRPKIVMPQVMLEEYARAEVQTILLHEKTHIRLGHLLFYFLWDILRTLLWLNPLLTIGTRLFREDMEEICDLVTIRRNEGKAYDYGQLLLKSMRVLQAESEDYNMFAAFAGSQEYQNIRQRVVKIVQYRPYKRITAAVTCMASLLCTVIAVTCIRAHSYGRYNESDVMFTYGYDGENVTFFDSKEALHQMISYDSNNVYVDREAFEHYLQEIHASGDIFIVFGGFYKLPGIGGIGYSCCYEPDFKGRVVKIPYESPLENWQVKLLKVL